LAHNGFGNPYMPLEIAGIAIVLHYNLVASFNVFNTAE